MEIRNLVQKITRNDLFVECFSCDWDGIISDCREEDGRIICPDCNLRNTIETQNE